MDFTVAVYKATATFPPDERFGLTSQLRRASSSMPLNIAEGSGNSSGKEFARFLEIAQRSGYECLTAIELAKRLNFVAPKMADALTIELHEIVAMIIGLKKTVLTRSK